MARNNAYHLYGLTVDEGFSEDRQVSLSIYLTIIGVVFCCLKSTNWILHIHFDRDIKYADILERRTKSLEIRDLEFDPTTAPKKTDEEKDSKGEEKDDKIDNNVQSRDLQIDSNKNSEVSEGSTVPIVRKAPTRKVIRTEVHTYIDEEGMTHTYELPVEEIEEDTLLGGDDEDSLPPLSDVPNVAQQVLAKSQDKEGAPQEKLNKNKEELPVAFVLFSNMAFPIPFRRLFLVSLFDKDSLAFLSVPMAVLVAWLAFEIRDEYKEFNFGVLWFIVATCHFSLLKSPQPDVISPRPDFNKITPFNRSFYFCLMAGLILILREFNSEPVPSIYRVNINFNIMARNTREFFVVFLLWFPLLYLFGLFPQVNTLLIYLFEQLNIHFFGSTGSRNLQAAFFDTVRNLAALAILFGLGYASGLVYGEGNSLFSLYLAVMVAISFWLSRAPSDPGLWTHLISPLQRKFSHAQVQAHPSSYPFSRMILDVALAFATLLLTFGLHVTTVFRFFHPEVYYIVAALTIFIGWVGHYVLHTLRKPNPLRLFQRPVLESAEFEIFDPTKPAKVMWFDVLYYALHFAEKAILYPFIFLIEFTEFAGPMEQKFGLVGASVLLSVFGLKLFRSAFSEPSRHWLVLFATILFFNFDAESFTEGFPFDYFISTIIVLKLLELINKIEFILIYSQPNPGNMSLGSIAHFILAPYSIPHMAAALFQTIISTLLSAPLYPFIGSVFFFTSYGRPVRFWERDYETQRLDASQIKLSEALEGVSKAEYNTDNLDSIFYEHLVTSLQESLNREIEAGRFGDLVAGDFLIIGNDHLTAMIHLVEVGNGHCTFQLRGMEFKSTYCHEQELAAIMSVCESVDPTIFKYKSLALSRPLGLLDILKLRLNTWEVVNIGLMIKTYSISKNPASPIFGGYDLCRAFLKHYVRACVYYLIRSPSLKGWLGDSNIQEFLLTIDRKFVDVDPIFTSILQEDYDRGKDGISFNSFLHTYGNWIEYCLGKQEDFKDQADDQESLLHRLCFAVSLLARRCLIVHQRTTQNTTHFLERFHTLFKGDFRVNSTRDEWVLADVNIMNQVLGQGIRISLKVHQDSFIEDDFDDPEVLYTALTEYEGEVVCRYEGDPEWRQAILNNSPSLITLRKNVSDEVVTGHNIVTLTLRPQKFRALKLNRESVRGLWAAQQQELIFLGNKNPERGSIQQFNPLLRNLINQSADFPVGYPNFVSPLTTSYSTFSAEAIHDKAFYKNSSLLKSWLPFL